MKRLKRHQVLEPTHHGNLSIRLSIHPSLSDEGFHPSVLVLYNVSQASFLHTLIAFQSVNSLDAEGLSLLPREEQRIQTISTNSNLTFRLLSSLNQHPRC